MVSANLHEAKKRLSYYTKLVKNGETVVLCDRNKPFAEIRPLGDAKKNQPPRELGLMKGLCPVGPEFFEADAQMASDFDLGPVFPDVPPVR